MCAYTGVASDDMWIKWKVIWLIFLLLLLFHYFIRFHILWSSTIKWKLDCNSNCMRTLDRSATKKTAQHRYAQCHNTTIHFYLIVKKREMHARTSHANNLPLALAVTLQSNRIRITVQLANGEKNILHSNEMHRLHQRHRCPFIDPCVRSSITVRSTVSSRKQ